MSISTDSLACNFMRFAGLDRDTARECEAIARSALDAAIAAERERCAKVCEKLHEEFMLAQNTRQFLEAAAAIRNQERSFGPTPHESHPYKW
jgi:hypothetical protein